MKFKQGHWVVKPDVTANYIVEATRTEVKNGGLQLIASTKHMDGRPFMQAPMITVKVSSPAEGVIGVELMHYKGVPEKTPEFDIACDGSTAEVHVDGDSASLKNGALEARISLKPDDWRMDFIGENGRYTGAGFRMMGYMADRTEDKYEGCGYMVQQLELDVGECVYGLGERFTAFVKNGQRVDMWNGDGGSCSELAYKNVPFYITNRGYGVLVDDSSDVSFEVASEQVERVQFSVQGERLRFYVIAGPKPLDVIRRYTALTGRPPLPPAWSFGLWLSTSFTTNYDEATTTSFIEGMAQRDIPLNVFHYDCFWMKGLNWCDFAWDEEMFPDPEGMLKRYHERGLKICCWINPYIAQFSPLFDEGMKNGYFITRTDGSVWQTDQWQPGMAIVDFTNPAAREWYRENLRRIMRMGVDCFKTDFAERIPVRNVKYFDGSDPLKMHNYYTYLYNEAVFSLIAEERGEDQAIVFARSGTVGSQKLPVHWGGDNFGSYISMAETLRGGLSLASSGFGFWSHDISGFETTAPADVYKRWCQFGLLSSHSRLHGSKSYRVPWMFDDEACVVLSKFTKLKCRLMPYIYQKAVEATETGAPVMRPMYMEFPDDPGCDNLDRQYMLGDGLLVAPVFREDGQVDYYLPEGRWTHLLDGRQVNGGRWMREKYDFMSLPLWVRENSVIAMGARDDTAEYDFEKDVELRCYNVENCAKVRIPDVHGSTAMEITLTRVNGILTADKPGSFRIVDIREE